MGRNQEACAAFETALRYNENFRPAQEPKDKNRGPTQTSSPKGISIINMTDKSKKLEKRAQREQERAAKRRQRYIYIFTAIAILMILITGVVLWQVYGPRETPIETIALAAGECTPAQAMMNYGRGDLQEGAQLPTYVDYPRFQVHTSTRLSGTEFGGSPLKMTNCRAPCTVLNMDASSCITTSSPTPNERNWKILWAARAK